MALTRILHKGASIGYDHRAFRLTTQIGRTSKLTFSVSEDASVVSSFAYDDKIEVRSVTVISPPTFTEIFNGSITKIKEAPFDPAMSSKRNLVISAEGNDAKLKRVRVQGAYIAERCGTIFKDINTRYGFSFNTAQVEDGPVLDEISFVDLPSVEVAFNRIVKAAARIGHEYHWRITPHETTDKLVFSRFIGKIAFLVDSKGGSTAGDFQDFTYERFRPAPLITAVYVVGGEGIHDEITDDVSLVDTAVNWKVRHKVGEGGTDKVKATATSTTYDLVERGVDDESANADFLYSNDEQEIERLVTLVGSEDALEFTYKPIHPVVYVYKDIERISEVDAFGRYDIVLYSDDVRTIEAAAQEASGQIIEQNVTENGIVKLRSRRDLPWLVGNRVTLNVPEHNIHTELYVIQRANHRVFASASGVLDDNVWDVTLTKERGRPDTVDRKQVVQKSNTISSRRHKARWIAGETEVCKATPTVHMTEIMDRLEDFTSVLAIWPFDDAVGASTAREPVNSHTGTYNGPTLRSGFVPWGGFGITLDASDDWVDAGSGFGGAFSVEGPASVIVLCRVSAASVWTDSTLRYLLRWESVTNPDDNRIHIQKQVANNQVAVSVTHGAVTKSRTHTFSTAPVGWFTLGMSLSPASASDFLRLYINGSKSGSDATGLGTYSGGATLATNRRGLWSNNGFSLWDGFGSLFIVSTAAWTDQNFSDAHDLLMGLSP